MKNSNNNNKEIIITSKDLNNKPEEIKNTQKINKNKYLELHGSNYFRLKIAYSLLLNRAIKISDIRSDSINPGLTSYEINFLHLISSITNGTIIHINSTGTNLTLIPGTITNNYGDNFTFETDRSRCITYYCEGLIPISFFGKESLHISLTGITNNDIDCSVDSFQMSTCLLMQKLIVGDNVEFKIKKRGVLPNGKGEVYFKIPIVTNFAPFDWKDEGKIKRVRGIAFTSKLQSSYSRALIDSCRGVLNNFLPDVYIMNDNYKDKNLNEISPGYGLSLCAETKNGFYLCSDGINDINNLDKNANDVAKEITLKFLNQIYCAGCINSNNQGLFLFLMALAEKNYVSYMKIGKITNYTKGVLILINKLLGVKFNIREWDEYDKEESSDDEEDNENNENEENEEEEDEKNYNFQKDEIPESYKQYIFSCVGIGLKNIARIELY